jgi:hypothetical protein
MNIRVKHKHTAIEINDNDLVLKHVSDLLKTLEKIFAEIKTIQNENTN